MSDWRRLETEIQRAILQQMVETRPQNMAALRKATVQIALRRRPVPALLFALVSAMLLLVTGIFLRQFEVAAIAAVGVIFIGAGSGMLVWRAVFNVAVRSQAMARIPGHNHPYFQINAIGDKRARVRLVKALQYWHIINNFAQKNRTSGFLGAGNALRRNITRGVQTIYTLAGDIDQLQKTMLVHTHSNNLPEMIKQIELKIEQESNPQKREQLARLLDSHQRQLDTLRAMQTKTNRALGQMDNMVAALGAICTQMTVTANTSRHAGKTNQLIKEITEEALRLQDLTEAMEEVRQIS